MIRRVPADILGLCIFAVFHFAVFKLSGHNACTGCVRIGYASKIYCEIK
jgi:hypothetical protein